MNLIGSYHHHHHHHHLVHDSFPFVPRCHQDAAPYFPGWVVNPGDAPGDFPAQAPYAAAAASASAAPVPAPELQAGSGPHPAGPCGGGGGRRRPPGPKKERRRTESINTAFAELRECIPNVPADTKLSKIKTLRLATSYIAYLMEVLAKDSGEPDAFKADIKKFDGRDVKRKRELSDGLQEALGAEKKAKGRTGWPQQVWALELNQ